MKNGKKSQKHATLQKKRTLFTTNHHHYHYVHQQPHLSFAPPPHARPCRHPSRPHTHLLRRNKPRYYSNSLRLPLKQNFRRETPQRHATRGVKDRHGPGEGGSIPGHKGQEVKEQPCAAFSGHDLLVNASGGQRGASGGVGANLFVACLRSLTIDHACPFEIGATVPTPTITGVHS